MKNEIKHGMVGGVIAGLMSVLYAQIYSSNMGVDFSAIAKPVMIIVACIVGTIIASVGYWFLKRRNWFGSKTEMIFITVFFLLSFGSIIGTFGVPLPEGIMKPELFSGLVIPMHFFPLLSWLMVKPIFENTRT